MIVGYRSGRGVSWVPISSASWFGRPWVLFGSLSALDTFTVDSRLSIATIQESRSVIKSTRAKLYSQHNIILRICRYYNTQHIGRAQRREYSVWCRWWQSLHHNDINDINRENIQNNFKKIGTYSKIYDQLSYIWNVELIWNRIIYDGENSNDYNLIFIYSNNKDRWFFFL